MTEENILLVELVKSGSRPTTLAFQCSNPRGNRLKKSKNIHLAERVRFSWTEFVISCNRYKNKNWTMWVILVIPYRRLINFQSKSSSDSFKQGNSITHLDHIASLSGWDFSYAPSAISVDHALVRIARRVHSCCGYELRWATDFRICISTKVRQHTRRCVLHLAEWYGTVLVDSSSYAR